MLPGLMVSMPSAGFERQAVSKAKFVSYDVLVQVDGHRWVVHRRYTDFCALADGIRHLGDLPPKLPGKRTFGNFKDDFIEARRGALEAYLQGVVENDETRAQTAASPASPAAAARADAAPPGAQATLEFLGAQTLQLGSLDSFPYAMRSGRFTSRNRVAAARRPARADAARRAQAARLRAAVLARATVDAARPTRPVLPELHRHVAP